MERWNYFFQSCRVICVTGQMVELPTGHGMVTLNEDGDFEAVFFPAKQLDLKLLPGETRRLENAGLAQRFGSVR